MDRKRCGRCGNEQPSDAFHRNASTPDGLHWTCRSCNTDPRVRQPLERRRTIRAYDLTREEFEVLRAALDDRCAICRVTFTATPHIDHDHATGRVRGLLCRRCNTGLGLFRDDPARLREAIRYLDADRDAGP